MKWMNSLTNNLFIVGGGGHALSVLEILKEKSMPISGYIDVTPSSKIDLPYVEENQFLSEFKYAKNKPEILLAVGTNADCSFRAAMADKYKEFPKCKPIASEKSIISRDVDISFGTVVMPGACIRTRSVIGQHCIINTMTSIDHECTLEENVHLGPGAILCGNVYLEKNVFIGAGAIIFPGVRILKNTTIPAGSKVK